MTHKPKASLIIAIWLVVAVPVAAHAEIYAYRKSDGTLLFTDRPQQSLGYKLIRRRGQPAANDQPCRGLRRSDLEARYLRYHASIKATSARHGIPLSLAKAVIAVESCFDHQAVSKAGAMGLMQLMPSTAAAMGVSDPFAPEQNIRGGIAYLAKMLATFSGDVSLALAAYNAGPNAVHRYRGIPPYPETKAYVERILQNYAGPRLISPKSSPAS